jgi:hypothetical protein
LLVGLVWLFFGSSALQVPRRKAFVDPALLADFSFSSLQNKITPSMLAAEGTFLARPTRWALPFFGWRRKPF